MARPAGGVRVRVAVDRAAVDEIRRVVANVGREIAGKALTQVVYETARDASWWVKANVRPRRRTGQTQTAIGARAKVYRDGAYHVGVVGARSKHTIRDPRFGRVTPTKYFHLIEGGRKEVRAKKSPVLAIKVLRLDPRGRPHKKSPGGWQWRLRPAPKPAAASRRGGSGGKAPARKKVVLPAAKSFGKVWVRGKKVGGGYVVFAPRAAAAPAYKVVQREKSRFGKYASAHVVGRLSAMVHKLARAKTHANIKRGATRLARGNI